MRTEIFRYRDKNTERTVRGSNAGKGKIQFFYSPQQPDRLCHPTSYWWVPGALSRGVCGWPLTCIWPRDEEWVELYLYSPCMPSWRGQCQLYLSTCTIFYSERSCSRVLSANFVHLNKTFGHYESGKVTLILQPLCSAVHGRGITASRNISSLFNVASYKVTASDYSPEYNRGRGCVHVGEIIRPRGPYCRDSQN